MKIVIHPLLFAVLLLSALFGGLPVALICVLTALLHECGHIFCARKLGYECRKIKLMPYGAAAFMDIEGIRASDEVRLALAGPLVNAAMCVALAGLWWFFPVTYGYTDIIMYANLAMLAVNLLPAYPLDGGRVAGCAIKKLFGERAQLIVLRIAALVTAAIFVALFFALGNNVTALIFAAFLLMSAFEKPVRAVRINFSSSKRLKRGIDVKYVLCDGELTFKDAIKRLSDRHYVVFQRYDGGVAEEVTQDELYELSLTRSVYDRVFDGYLSRNDLENSLSSMSPPRMEEMQSTPSEMPSSIAPESVE